MEESRFWEIIEASRPPTSVSPDEQCKAIISVLSECSKEEIASFSNIHRQLLCKAFTWPLLKACLIIVHYVSDDAFEDFRNWLILQGKEAFYGSIDNPDFIASFISVSDPVEECTGEALLYVCEEAWDGDIEDLEERYKYPKEPDLDQPWPSKQSLESEFPNIYARFWDDEVIDY